MPLVFGQELDEECNGEFKNFSDVRHSVLRKSNAEVWLDGRNENLVVAKRLSAALKHTWKNNQKCFIKSSNLTLPLAEQATYIEHGN